jgi:hypothetical protein
MHSELIRIREALNRAAGQPGAVSPPPRQPASPASTPPQTQGSPSRLGRT